MLGGLAGAAAGIVGEQFIPGSFSSGTFYVLIGMCAMMGATLQAPLAALMALLELSDNPNIILPAMLIIVVANITSSEIFKTRSVFHNSLEPGQSGFSPELSRFLNRFGVSTIVNYKFITLAPETEKDAVIKSLQTNPEWIVIDYEGHNDAIISRSALELALDNPNSLWKNWKPPQPLCRSPDMPPCWKPWKFLVRKKPTTAIFTSPIKTATRSSRVSSPRMILWPSIRANNLKINHPGKEVMQAFIVILTCSAFTL